MERPNLNDPREKEIAAELRRNFTEWMSVESEFLKNAEQELDFLAGQHWIDESNQSNRQQELWGKGRSAFTIDLLSPSVDLVINQIRINKLTANFIPLGEGADVATADIRQGLYRNIDRVSKAAIARETAYQFAVSVGRGYERVLIEDEDGPTFRRRITILRVDNLHNIAMDPTGVDFQYRDASWGFAFDDMWKDQFRQQYRSYEVDDSPIDSLGLELGEDQRALWFPKDKVRVGEYFKKIWKMREVVELSDRRTFWKDEPPKEGYGGAHVVRIKEKLDYTLEWRRMTGTQTLEKRVWPGKLIPIVVFIGREIFRGRRPKINSGMVRPAMAPSVINNYAVSRMVDEVALSPLPHFMAMQGQLTPEQKNLINTINSKPWSVVEQTPMEDSEGRQLPPGAWVSPSPNISAVVEIANASTANLERVLNTYAPQKGAQVNSESGKAINAVKESGDISHAAFPDNFQRAITYEADVVNELMDAVYTDPQAITITQPDEKTMQVLINQEYQDKRTGKIMNHIFGGHGDYGIEVAVAQSYPSRQAEAVQRIIDLVGKVPAEMARSLDLIIKILIPGPIGEKFAQRYQPPGYSDPDEGPDITTVMGHLQASQSQLQEADKLISMMQGRIKQLESKSDIEKLRIFSQMAIAAANNEAGIIEAQIKGGVDAAHAVLMAQLERITAAMEDPATEGLTDASVVPNAGAPAQPAAVPPTAAPAPPAVGLVPPGGAPATPGVVQ